MTQHQQSTPTDTYIYVFVRQDLPFNHQLVQSGHAIHMMSAIRGYDEVMHNIVAIGVPDLNALNRVVTKLQTNQIPHYPWTEPDNDFGLTSVCTIPLSGAERSVLKNYRLYNSPSDVTVCAFNGKGGAISGVPASG